MLKQERNSEYNTMGALTQATKLVGEVIANPILYS